MADVRVLVVDDQDVFRRAMAAVVDETEGFVTCGSAASGEESLCVARQVLPDLVLMDLHLPGMDGVEASRLLLAGPRPPVVVLLSTYDEAEVDLQGATTAYVRKGVFGPDRLASVWRSAPGR